MLNRARFDWKRYYELAKSYENENDYAKLRTGIGRFYYSCFLESRDHIIKNKFFLNEINENIMLSTSGRIHRETRITLEKHKKLNHKYAGKKLLKD